MTVFVRFETFRWTLCRFALRLERETFWSAPPDYRLWGCLFGRCFTITAGRS